MNARILIVDDEKNIRRSLGMILRSEGCRVREAPDGEAALAEIEPEPADVVFLDVNLPGMDGIAVLKELRRLRPETAVIMISGQASIAAAVEATREGAFDFLEKPLSRDRVLIAARNALKAGTLIRRVDRFERAEARRWTMIGDSDALDRVRRQIQRAAPTGATVLIAGESGTGKELVARALHEGSPRREGPFVKVNCAAIPEELIESELFGAVRGAFTGADRSRDGKFLAADGGTLFLDEIGDMSLKVQAKVLRALQEGEIERVGDNTTRRVDVRVLAATNKDLAAEVREGRFREDLFYRLNVVPLSVPPLRERMEDLEPLCAHFLALFAEENGLPPKRLAPPARLRLSGRRWPGNIRELANVIERLAILSEGPEIRAAEVDLLAPEEGGTPRPEARGVEATGVSPETIRDLGGLNAARRDFERRAIEACLDRTGGNVSGAARLLGIERSNLHKKMLALGLEARPARDSGDRKGESS